MLLEWAEKASKKYVSKELSQEIHNKAEPFISWLREAEEESGSESEDDLEVSFLFFCASFDVRFSLLRLNMMTAPRTHP